MRNERTNTGTKKKLTLERTSVVVLTERSLERVEGAGILRDLTLNCHGCGTGNESHTQAN